jgi:hypothetical protein
MIRWWWTMIGKECRRKRWSLAQTMSWCLLDGGKYNHEKTQSGLSEFRPRFEEDTYRIQDRRVTPWAKALSLRLPYYPEEGSKTFLRNLSKIYKLYSVTLYKTTFFNVTAVISRSLTLFPFVCVLVRLLSCVGESWEKQDGHGFHTQEVLPSCEFQVY